MQLRHTALAQNKDGLEGAAHAHLVLRLRLKTAKPKGEFSRYAQVEYTGHLMEGTR